MHMVILALSFDNLGLKKHKNTQFEIRKHPFLKPHSFTKSRILSTTLQSHHFVIQAEEISGDQYFPMSQALGQQMQLYSVRIRSNYFTNLSFLDCCRWSHRVGQWDTWIFRLWEELGFKYGHVWKPYANKNTLMFNSANVQNTRKRPNGYACIYYTRPIDTHLHIPSDGLS